MDSTTSYIASKLTSSSSSHLPCFSRFLFLLDLQNFSKRNKEDAINGQESDGSENKHNGTGTTPAQKNDKTVKGNEIIINRKSKLAHSSEFLILFQCVFLLLNVRIFLYYQHLHGCSILIQLRRCNR
jgi:hypothetical protein